MLTVDTLLTERLDDLRDDAPGNVRATVDHLLGAANDALWERREAGSGDGGLITATSHVDAAIGLLEGFKARIEALDKLDAEQAFAAAK